MLTVVLGPPAAGKSTWVLERAKPGDVVIDFDRLAVALTGPGGDPHDHPAHVVTVTMAARTAAIDAALALIATVQVYVIHTSPNAGDMAHYRLLGADIVTINPGHDVVRERVAAERPARMASVAQQWYTGRRPRRPPKPPQASPSYSFPGTP